MATKKHRTTPSQPRNKSAEPIAPATRAAQLRPAGLFLTAGVLLVIIAAGFWAFHRSQPAPDASASLAHRSRLPNAPELGDPSAVREKTLLAEQVNRANQRMAQGKPEEAVALLKQALEHYPDDEDVHYNLGIALARLGKNDEAADAYEHALRIFPDYAEVHNNYGNLFLRLGKIPEAVDHFEKAVKISPEYAGAWNNLGTALQKLGQTNESLEKFQTAARLDTNYWQAYFNLGNAFLQRRQFAYAQTNLQRVLELKPDFTPAREALAKIADAERPGP